MNRLTQLLEFLQENPNDPFLKYCIALEYDKLNEPEQTLRYFTNLVENHPSYIATYYHLGKFYEKQGLEDQAANTYEKGLQQAQQAKDMHAYSELLNAKNELVNNYDIEFDV
jgi:tetratricopeptide (TPR) repeat protein